MELRIRKDILPKRFGDICCFLFIIIFFPMVSFYDVVVVLPAVHEPQEFMYKFIFALSIFLIYNIMGNMFVAMTVDTSVDVINANATIPQNARERGWFDCSQCKKLAPPRSHHCKACNKCILKRDHHCVFTGCCIGHYNMRYFALFLFYMFIASSLSFGYLNYYMFWQHADIFLHKLSFYKMAFPILLIYGNKWYNLPLAFYNLNIIALVISSILLIYHGIPMIKGGTSYERRLNYPYSKGLYNNLREIFGKNMSLVWISPFISSELLDDGTNKAENTSNGRPSRRRSRSRRRS